MILYNIVIFTKHGVIFHTADRDYERIKEIFHHNVKPNLFDETAVIETWIEYIGWIGYKE